LRGRPQADCVDDLPSTGIDERDSVCPADEQPERFTAAGTSEVLHAALSLIVRRADALGRIEVRREPATRRARVAQFGQLISNGLLVEVHRDTLEYEQCRALPVESPQSEGVHSTLNVEIRLHIGRPRLGCQPGLVQLGRWVIQLEELHALATKAPRTAVVAGPHDDDLLDTVLDCSYDLGVVPQDAGCQAGQGDRQGGDSVRPPTDEAVESGHRGPEHLACEGVVHDAHVGQQGALCCDSLRRPGSLVAGHHPSIAYQGTATLAGLNRGRSSVSQPTLSGQRRG
jgi:hypothetical protein